MPPLIRGYEFVWSLFLQIFRAYIAARQPGSAEVLENRVVSSVPIRLRGVPKRRYGATAAGRAGFLDRFTRHAVPGLFPLSLRDNFPLTHYKRRSSTGD